MNRRISTQSEISLSDSSMEEYLKKYFGFLQFRPYQKEIIKEVLRGRDSLVVMATGSGKSLCYQLPALVSGKTAVVISPLLSLIQDQVMHLKRQGIRAEYLGSTQTNRAAYSNAENGKFDLLYMTPEKACSLSRSFWTNLRRMGICLLAIDEAHCISEWGLDFRKDYKKLHELRDVLFDVPCIALTSTVTKKVQNDILRSLNMSDPYIAIGSSDRRNRFYGVKNYSRALSLVDELVTEVAKYTEIGGSTIIYCTTVIDTELIYKKLRETGMKVGIYHGQMSRNDRGQSHISFVQDEIQVMVATVAFGMGIDKPNIRCVIHYGCPKSLESYYQESGSCGRDGSPSVCWLYYLRGDFGKADFYCSEVQSENQKKAVRGSFKAAEKYCLLATCRRKFLLQYFGEECTNDCGNCDNCTGHKRERDLSRESFLLLSCIESCGSCWGFNMPIDILRGSRSKRVLENNYEKLPSHGLGNDYSSNWWKALAGLLIANGYLQENGQGTYRTVSVSSSGKTFLLSANALHKPPLVLAITRDMIDEEERGGQQKKVGEFNNLTSPECEGFSKHLVSKCGDSFLQGRSPMLKEVHHPFDGEATTVQTVRERKVHGTSERKLTPARFNAWQLWKNNGLSIEEVARDSGIKESTVISYILKAAVDGHEMNWARFCDEIGLTSAVAAQIRSAVTKVGSRDRLKPIKEELPESVSYGCINTFLRMEDLNVSAEAMGVLPLKMDSPIVSCSPETFAGTKQPRRDDPLLNESSLKKLHKSNDQENNRSNGLEATQTTLLEWIAEHDGVSLTRITDHFRGSTEESITHLLGCLEGDYVIFRKNDMYQTL